MGKLWSDSLSFSQFGIQILKCVVFSILGCALIIPVHEFIHWIAYKKEGANDVRFGAIWKSFVFYAAAHNFAADYKTFRRIALAPFYILSVLLVLLFLFPVPLWGKISIAAILLFHIISCSGDLSMLSYMKRDKRRNVITVDDIDNRFTYFMEKSALENGELLGPYFSNWSMERYYTLMDRMNFSPSKQLWQLSKGEYMKMQTCFALAHHPRFLILDEPLEGFDPVFRKNFLSIMQDILNEDVGIFISSHITETLKKLADYLLFADNGIITFHCPEQMDAFLADKLKRSHTHIRDLLSRNS